MENGVATIILTLCVGNDTKMDAFPSIDKILIMYEENELEQRFHGEVVVHLFNYVFTWVVPTDHAVKPHNVHKFPVGGDHQRVQKLCP
jgi:hypothetical protein